MIKGLIVIMYFLSFITSANNINEVEILEPIPVEEVVRSNELPSRWKGRGEYFKITAYDSSYESCGKHPDDPEYKITSTGLRVREGIVAVDPRVIPYHSRVYIEGLGEFEAADCGGDIVGEWIDVYIETGVNNENKHKVSEFGVQSRKVYIIKP